MTSEVRPTLEVGGRRFAFEPHHCFACGELNEHGLHLELHADERGCETELTLDSRFQGWDGVAHGGILATILDEVMAWSTIGRGVWAVTARMAVEYRRPAPVGRPLRAVGSVTAVSRRVVKTAGRIEDSATGDVLARATGTYIAAPPERRAELQRRYRMRTVDDLPEPVATR